MDSPRSLHSKTVCIGIVASFFALTFLVYGASLGNGFSFLDDGLLIYENNAIRAINGETLWAIFTSYDPELYIPLTLLSYQIDYRIGELIGLTGGGYSPLIYHLTNLVLHTLNALLVTWFVLLLLRSSPRVETRGYRRHEILMSLLCGIIFAIHPLNTEAVAWAAARKDLLSGFFFLGALVAYLLYRSRASCVGAPRCGARWEQWKQECLWKQCLQPGATAWRPYALSVALFLLGLLSKVTIVTLPVILLLVDLLQQRKFSKCLILDKFPYFVLSILFGLIALGGKEGTIGATTVADKALLAGKSAVFYLQKLFLPFNLSVFYPQLTDIRITAPEFFVPPLLLLLLAACIGALYLPFQYTRETLKNTSSGAAIRKSLQFATVFEPSLRVFQRFPGVLKCLQQRRRDMVFGMLFFLTALSPSFLTVAKGGNIFFASDRYAYIASIGMLYAVFSVLSGAGRGKFSFSIFNVQCSIRGIALGAIVLTLAGMTVRQSLLWGNNVKMLERSIRLFPDFSMHYTALGAHYRLEKRPKEALEAYGKALSLNEMSNTYGLIGQVHAEEVDYGRAVAEFEKGLALNRDDAELHYGLGQVYALKGNFDAALSEYERSLALQPEDRNAYRRLSRRISARRDRIYWRIGLLFGDEGDHARAVEYHGKAIEENPSFADAHYNLAVGLGQLLRFDEAIEHYERAIALDPRHVKARVNLGMLYANAGKRREAIAHFEKALELEPRNARAREALQKIR